MSTYNEEAEEQSEKIDKDLGKEMKKDLAKSDKEQYSTLQAQCEAEISLAYDHQIAKKTEQLMRLKLYNNQRRDKSAVGDTTMFTVHQTVLASLYDDRLAVEWLGREDGDDETAENLNAMAEFDYDEMEKDQLDYDWDWDTLFFGRGLLNETEYVRDPDNNIYVPAPEVWDPTTFLRDPRAVSVNGNTLTGKNRARFFGRPVRMTKEDCEKDEFFLSSTDFSSIKYGTGTSSLIENASQARDDAQGHNTTDAFKSEKKLGDNAEYEFMEWYTHWRVNGELRKVRVWLANKNKKVVGFKDLSVAKRKWGLIDRPLYPTSHDWDGTSIPDLTEDKQRHRAVAQNLGLKMMTADLYPSYAYDQNKIKNRNYLKPGFNKFIPTDGPPQGVMEPMRKASPNMALLDFIYTSLDISAQKATATPDIQQGIQSEKNRPLGETNILKTGVDTRYSLAAKVFGWSEKRFWQQWYLLYKDNFDQHIDKKVLRLKSNLGTKWRPLSRDNIIALIDPDCKVESRNVNRAKMMEDRILLKDYFTLALQEPTSNKRWALKKLGKVNGLMADDIDMLLPPTIDELQARDENDLLNKNEYVQVLDGQDHVAHLGEHMKANQTKATMAHIETTKHMMMIQKMKAMAEAKKQQQGQVPGQSSQPAAGMAPTGPGGIPQQLPGSAGNVGSGGVAPSQTSGSPQA